jgi:D-aminopeptidase
MTHKNLRGGKRRPIEGRHRLRQLGVRIGNHPTGRYNAITDVPGVRVGQVTIIRGHGDLRVGEGPVRTGVTAILPIRNIFDQRVIGSGFILNGAGEVSGLTQLVEWGLMETPIILTNTLSVGTCSDAVVKYMVERHPGIGIEHDVIIPIVGECDDSWLNDIGGGHITDDHVYEALEKASDGPVAEGNVGGGTGMVTCDFKGGIGTSSRRLPPHQGGYTIGVLVMSNFGKMGDLRLDGMPIGEIIASRFEGRRLRDSTAGSIIVVVATNAPFSAHQVARLCKRSALGIGRVGSFAEHGSGEIIVGFSTANTIPRQTNKMLYRMKLLLDSAIDPLYRAVEEATEEAILNSIFMADTLDGHSGNVAYALPINDVMEIVKEISSSFKKFQ